MSPRADPTLHDRLLAAATAEFVAVGFHDASLNGILATAAVSKGSFYHAFEDKEALFVAVVEAELGRFSAGFHTPLLPDGAFWAWVERLSFEAIAAIGAAPHGYPLARDLYRLAPKSPRVAALLAPLRAWLEAVVAAGRASGDLRADVSAELMVEAIFALGVGIDAWAVARGPLPPAEEFAALDGAYRLIRAMVAAPDAGATS